MKFRDLRLPNEFLFQVFALILSALIVHVVYVTLIRPEADARLAEQAAALAAGQEIDTGRSIAVVLRDYEQETCFILLLWALAVLGYKGLLTLREAELLRDELIPLSEGISILPEDTRDYARPIQSLPGDAVDALLPRALLAALQRFASTRNVQDVSEAVRAICDTEADRMDAELSMVRYIAWAIPSIGFIGTVRGIGAALGQAYKAVEGDIAGVTAALGTAFNSTFIALVLSIVLMFVMHQIQLMQERLVLDAQAYCDTRLIRHMQVRAA